MLGRLYKDYFILAWPSFDTATNAWAPQADVSWNHKAPSRQFAFIRFPNRFKTEAEAIAFALDNTQNWLDKHTRRLHGYGVRSELAKVIDVVDTLKRDLARSAPKETHAAPAARPISAEKRFTFEQFKSAIARRGLRINQQTLRKSYAALVQLRKNQGLTWAETRRKVEQSDLQTPPLAHKRTPRAAGIPLTEAQWRKAG